MVDGTREVMNVHQAAHYLGISSDTLYKYVEGGILPAFKLGNRWRFKRSLVDRWIETQSLPAAAPLSAVRDGVHLRHDAAAMELLIELIEFLVKPQQGGGPGFADTCHSELSQLLVKARTEQTRHSRALRDSGCLCIPGFGIPSGFCPLHGDEGSDRAR